MLTYQEKKVLEGTGKGPIATDHVTVNNKDVKSEAVKGKQSMFTDILTRLENRIS